MYRFVIDRLVGKGGNSSDSTSQDKSVNVVSSFVGVHSLQIHYVPDDVVLIRYTIASQHVPSHSRNVQGLSCVVPLDHRDHFRRVSEREILSYFLTILIPVHPPLTSSDPSADPLASTPSVPD